MTYHWMVIWILWPPVDTPDRNLVPFEMANIKKKTKKDRTCHPSTHIKLTRRPTSWASFVLQPRPPWPLANLWGKKQDIHRPFSLTARRIDRFATTSPGEKNWTLFKRFKGPFIIVLLMCLRYLFKKKWTHKMGFKIFIMMIMYFWDSHYIP